MAIFPMLGKAKAPIFLAHYGSNAAGSHSQKFLLAWAGFIFLFFHSGQIKAAVLHLAGCSCPCIASMSNAAASTPKHGRRSRWPLMGTGPGPP